jgi:DEAD/DEAH box helicase domain-containing protein
VIPTAVAHEARTNLLDYLQTTYSLKDEGFEKELLEFLGGPEGLFRGPYLDVRLPFRQAEEGEEVPLEIRPDFRPYWHQMRAFERLHGQRGHQPQHTLVTTGTGSGKTECFLYPILDHCHRERQKGRKGVKAILLYPMNALATDQARRLAKTLWDDERLKGRVTAGLYVGQKGSCQVAERERLVDDRGMLRQSPPDILLTNYKMLDFLLLRPEDQVLWQQNGPDRLRFLVLDELHTYDGAQGSDVACLIRRLKERLRTPEGGLTCVGTSATIGEADATSKRRLTDFAGQIFDDMFREDSVITEDRLSIGEAIGFNRDLEDHPRKKDLGSLGPRGKELEEWLLDQRVLWFGEQASDWSREELGRRLKRHDFLHLLLKALNGRAARSGEIAEQIAKRETWFRDLDADARELVLNSFVGLISHARSAGDAPFLSVQVQVWLREIRHLLRKVQVAPEFAWQSEQAAQARGAGLDGHYLPMIRCTDCGCSGFAAKESEERPKLIGSRAGESLGRAWMQRDSRVRFVLLGAAREGSGHLFPKEFLCPACLGLSEIATCGCAGSEPLATLPVRIARDQTKEDFPKFRPICPDCGGEDSLMWLASRAASLLSVAISHLYQTQYNEDRKLLAFVDSVQDASHRAGFFGARTYRFNLRALIQELVDQSGGQLALEGFGKALLRHTEDRLGGAKKAIPVLMPEDLRAHPDYEEFIEKGGRGDHVALRAWLTERLQLEVVFEFGFSVRSGRSLEKTGCSTLQLDESAIQDAAKMLSMIVEEDGFLASRQGSLDEAEAMHFLRGLVHRLRLRGGIVHPLLRGYLKNSGKRFMLSRKMSPTGPIFGDESVLPRFLLKKPPQKGVRSAFDAYSQSPDRLTWYRDWASRCLQLAIDDDGVAELYENALEQLVRTGVLEVHETEGRTDVWGLNAESLAVSSSPVEISCDSCAAKLRIASSHAQEWAGKRCTQYRCGGTWSSPSEIAETFYTRIFREGRVARVFSEEHTGLLARKKREQVEIEFKADEEHQAPNAPNLLVCTPTLEMGIDIGDLSAVLLCGVPPEPTNYLQRVGRAGRSTGNALAFTMANARPHDLYFHAEPMEMLRGAIDPPGCFLDAPEMLKRQVVAYAMDQWARQETKITAIPRKMTAIFAEGALFPARFLEFYQGQKDALLSGFLGRFEKDVLSSDSRESLKRFALSHHVRDRVWGAFEKIREERRRLARLRERAKKRAAELEKDPSTAEVDAKAEIKEAEDNMKMLSHIQAELGRRYPLNVLTDAGVLPNYAFPEEGVELASVVSVPEPNGAVRYDSYDYRRPASSAIRELAPFNTFYAEGRRVKVDEIDLGASAEQPELLETWRLCCDCDHAVRAEGEDQPPVHCPRCGHAGWADVGRKRKMVFFRRSRSLASRLEAATVDDGDERSQEHYQTESLIDVRQENCSGARVVKALPFGFELLEGLKLREINFGLDRDSKFPVAGRRQNENGFEVCRSCGRVAKKPGAEIRHAFTCPTKRGTKEKREKVYLYREVESEAIRILLPVAAVNLEVQIASFRGALQLGLRRRYGGRAPHLQVKTMREPVPSGGHSHFLVLFDAVPGGTGLLKDLYRNDSLLDVLEKALEALKQCRCRARSQDGCYRCVFAHQQQRELENTSSSEAQQMIESILLVREGLEDASTLSEVVLDSRLESELEEKFIRALQQRVEKAGGSVKRLLRKGKERWELRIDEYRWEVEPQVDLGPTQGVGVATRPDFVIYPLSASADQRPVAVYCDGFAYHVQPDEPRSRIADDLLKRRAVLDSGRFLLWTVTWKDVAEFIDGADSLDSPFFASTSDAARKVTARWGVQGGQGAVSHESMRLLWTWLRQPHFSVWRDWAAAASVHQALAPTGIGTESARRNRELLLQSQESWSELPANEQLSKASPSFVQARQSSFVNWMVSLPSSAVRGEGGDVVSSEWVIRLLDRQICRQSPKFEADWRRFWNAVNVLQFGTALAICSCEDIDIRAALDADPAPVLEGPGGASVAAEGVSAFAVPDLSQAEGLGDYFEDERPVVLKAKKLGIPLPESSYELMSSSGRCVAEAALAWPELKHAVLVDASSNEVAAFERAGWTVSLKISDAASICAAVQSALAKE